ncbi:MAG: Flp pilus assembly complex ATPase component TadA [Acidobacteria bacterium]|nr:Flp pilus assembly complex ATPase component TadA [Acidobacteriota bacterium]
MIAAADQFSYTFAREKGLVCLPAREALTVAFREGADPKSLLEARRVLGRMFDIEVITREAYEQVLSDVFASAQSNLGEIGDSFSAGGDLASLVEEIPQSLDVLDSGDDAPVIRLLNGIVHDAVGRRASDIHIEPFDTSLSIRYRIDGDLVDVISLPRKLAAPVASRIKVMARLDIAERRLPQDGRISLNAGGRSFDVRVATLPTRFGERVVLRLLDARNVILSLDQLGMDPQTLERFEAALLQPNGVILVTGPVGSGKTTTLYATLSRLKTGRENIMTLEDPVEYGLAGISQTQMDHRVGLSFASALRSILRQDPNIVMVGEIRDAETADVAFEFASTGRLALSTLHTNSAAGAITRLRDMGVEPYLLSSTLRAVLAQRLVRRLCPVCKRRRCATEAEKSGLGLPLDRDLQVCEAVGCMSCAQSGFKGRLSIYELLVADSRIRQMIGDNAPEDAIAEAAFAGEHRLIENAHRYILAGETTPGEVIRVCRREDRDAGV